MLKSYSLNRLLALIVACGFLFLMVDSIVEHLEILSQDVMAYIPIAFSGIGVVVGAIAVFQWKEKWIRLLHIFLLATFLVAAGGLYYHIAEEDEEELTAEKAEHEKKEKDKPPLAPLAFGGIAVVGLLGTSRRWAAEVKGK